MKKIISVITAFSILILCGGISANAEEKKIIDSRAALDGLYEYFHEGDSGCFGGVRSYETLGCPHYAYLYLKKFGLFPDTISSDSKITKRDILDILYKIKGKHSPSKYWAPDEEKAKENFAIFKDLEPMQRFGFYGLPESSCAFEDIPEDSEDFFYAFQLWSAGLLCGTVVDGKLYALLYNEATYGDAVSFVSRLFLANPDFPEYQMKQYMKEIGYTDNIMFHFAEKIRLINDDPLLELYPTRVSLEQWNEKIDARVFCDLLYKALHIPTFSTEHLGEKFYYINDLLADPDSIFKSTIPSENNLQKTQK